MEEKSWYEVLSDRISSEHPEWARIISAAESPDIFYYSDLATAANAGSQVARNAIADIFSCDATPINCKLISDLCFCNLLPVERETVARKAERALAMLTSTPSPIGAQQINERLCDEATPPLRVLRLRKRMTQKELSEKSGVSLSQIRRMESGVAKSGNVTLANAVALAKALGVDAAELLGDSSAER